MVVYLLYCPVSGKGYVGQTIYSLDHRWQEHLADAKFERDNCRALEAAIRKYGENCFERKVLQECFTIEELNIAEEYHIRAQNTLSPSGYNLHTGGRNHQVSKETRERLSRALKGRKFSEQHRARLATASAGNKANLGRKLAPFSTEHRRKLSEARKGKPGHPHTKAHKQYMREVMLARWAKKKEEST